MLLILSVLVAGAFACSQPSLPSAKVTSCSSDPILDIDISSVKLTPYPIHKKDQTMLAFNYNNKGPQVDKPKVDIEAWWFGGVLCKYHKIPLPLNNQDACVVFGSCPLKAGENAHNDRLKIPDIDTALGLYGVNKAYKIKMTIKDASGKVLGCLQTESMTA